MTTSLTESPTTVVVSKATTYLIPGGKDFESSSKCGFGGLVYFERVGVRKLLHADADRLVSAVQEIGVVALCANLRPPDILELHNAVRRVLENDVFEFPRAPITVPLRAALSESSA